MTAAQPYEGPPTTESPVSPDERASTLVVVRRTLDQLSVLSARIGVPVLRIALGLVYVWFGGLKIFGRSEVFHLVAVTLPFVNPYVFVPVLGVIEVLLGVTSKIRMGSAEGPLARRT